MKGEKFKGSWSRCQEDGLESLFLNECIEICSNPDKFNSFKRNNIFTKIIGNDVREKVVSDIWYDFLKNTKMFDNIEKYKQNDIFGQPILYEYPKIGQVSPGTLCFMAIAQDISTRLIDIENISICEIGSGYGGQAKIFLDYGCLNVDLVDREQTLSLAKKYLGNFNYDNVEYFTTNKIPDKHYDLVVSNWCISELDKEGIQFYIDYIVSKSNYGYFLTNFRRDNELEWFIQKLELVFSEVRVEEEQPRTNENINYAILCKK